LPLLLFMLTTVTPHDSTGNARSVDEEIAQRIIESALLDGRAYRMLAELTGRIGARLGGSPEAARAVEWGRATMLEQGLEHVHLQPVMVPHWVRGEVERATLVSGAGRRTRLRVCALGGSIATAKKGVTAEVIEVRSLEEATKLGRRARGKIIFFNRPMDRAQISMFAAYAGAADQRVDGPSTAAAVGAVAVLVRSMTTSLDEYPHTGMLRYSDTAPKIPAAAISTLDAELLSRTIRHDRRSRVTLRLDCRTLPDAESHNVIGEITGREKPEEVVLVGGHLDSWDISQGAHDDGAGCVQAIEAVRLLKSLGLRPKRTIRAVLFMNEENGLRGGRGYAESVGREGPRHIAAIESDRGGFAPRGFAVDAGADIVRKLGRWSSLFTAMGADRFFKEGGGADIAPLKAHGTLCIGLVVESHRYFDYHHSAKDTFDKVNERELALGAAAMALLAYLIAEKSR
jgi:hypothetical protein